MKLSNTNLFNVVTHHTGPTLNFNLQDDFNFSISQQIIIQNRYMSVNYTQTMIEDYLNALKKPIKNLTDLVKKQYRSLEDTFDIHFNEKMSVIEQQQTDRQYEQQDQASKIKKQFNMEIKCIIKTKDDFEEIINNYKIELKKIAQSLISLEEEKRKVRDHSGFQPRNSKDCKSKPKEKQQRKQNQSKSLSNSRVDDQLKIRQAPQPVKQNVCLNCIKIDEDKNKWRSLSIKIQEFKKRNNIFQHDLKQKEEEIDSLKKTIASLQKKNNTKDEEEKKKLKKENTTMRGQKVLMANQLNALKKQLLEKTQFNQIQDLQIKKLRIQLDNLNSSLNWHVSNLSQMRNSHNRSINNQQRDQSERIQSLKRINSFMTQALEEQGKNMENLNQKTKLLEQHWSKQLDKNQKKINQLQSMLEDKNETIIKLKTGARNDKSSNYHSDMIKILNKKLTERQQKIRLLQEQLQHKQNGQLNQFNI